MDIPFGKVLIYVLTFIGYVYSGYGSGILSNLRDAVISAESMFGGVFQNVVQVANKFRNLNDIFDAALEEDCVFKCPGGVSPKPNHNHKPSANGCGALGLNVNSDYLPLTEMTKCCDTHDICYDTCNSVKEHCDIEFRRCLYKYCDSYGEAGSMVKTCKAASKVLFTSTLTLGCRAYLEAQGAACYCPPSYGWKDKKKYLKYESGQDL